MIDFFFKIYGQISPQNKFFEKVKLNSILRVMITSLMNIILPLFFRATQKSNNNRLNKQNVESPLIIVSLTTFPGRIHKIWIVIECMFRQRDKPDKIILWLSKDQFNDLKKLPNRLLLLRKRGLEIILCEGDLRSHKKYYYTLKKYPNDTLITIDDDFFYPSYLISDLLRLNRDYPNAICCERSHRISVNVNEIEPYKSWSFMHKGTVPDFRIFQTSGGGTLYPPNSLGNYTLRDDIFMEYCQDADDVWLNMMAQMKNTKTMKSDRSIQIIPIYFKNSQTLSAKNVELGQNDEQLRNVRNYFIGIEGTDPLINLFDNKTYV